MLTVKISAVIAVVAAAALGGAAIGYGVAINSTRIDVAGLCPTSPAVEVACRPPRPVPNGPTVPIVRGRGW